MWPCHIGCVVGGQVSFLPSECSRGTCRRYMNTGRGALAAALGHSRQRPHSASRGWPSASSSWSVRTAGGASVRGPCRILPAGPCLVESSLPPLPWGVASSSESRIPLATGPALLDSSPQGRALLTGYGLPVRDAGVRAGQEVLHPADQAAQVRIPGPSWAGGVRSWVP